jgi:hypothetical protein
MTTRRQVLVAGIAGILADPVAAVAASSDRAPLSALVAYQQEVVSTYDAALGGASADDRESLEALRRRAEQAAAALRRALAAVGAKAAATTGPASNPGLRGLIRAEEALVSSYYVALQSLDDERHLKAAAAFMADTGRRLVVLRNLAGEELLPRPFETGGA